MAVDLDSLAVGAKKGEDAAQILQLFIATGPHKEMDHAPVAEPVVAPGGMSAAGSIDPLKR